MCLANRPALALTHLPNCCAVVLADCRIPFRRRRPREPATASCRPPPWLKCAAADAKSPDIPTAIAFVYNTRIAYPGRISANECQTHEMRRERGWGLVGMTHGMRGRESRFGLHRTKAGVCVCVYGIAATYSHHFPCSAASYTLCEYMWGGLLGVLSCCFSTCIYDGIATGPYLGYPTPGHI